MNSNHKVLYRTISGALLLFGASIAGANESIEPLAHDGSRLTLAMTLPLVPFDERVPGQFAAVTLSRIQAARHNDLNEYCNLFVIPSQKSAKSTFSEESAAKSDTITPSGILQLGDDAALVFYIRKTEKGLMLPLYDVIVKDAGKYKISREWPHDNIAYLLACLHIRSSAHVNGEDVRSLVPYYVSASIAGPSFTISPIPHTEILYMEATAWEPPTSKSRAGFVSDDIVTIFDVHHQSEVYFASHMIEDAAHELGRRVWCANMRRLLVDSSLSDAVFSKDH